MDQERAAHAGTKAMSAQGLLFPHILSHNSGRRKYEDAA